MATSNGLRLRRGVPADAAALADLAARTFAETFGPDNDPAHIAVARPRPRAPRP